MPVEKDEKTEGKQWIEKQENNESKKQENNRSKRKKKYKGKLIFYGKNCLHGSESEKKLKLFKRYCGETENGNGKGKGWGKTGKWKQRQAKESEGKEEKKHNAINKEERRRWRYNWIRSTDLLMIDSKCEWQRRRFLKREKEKNTSESDEEPELQS